MTKIDEAPSELYDAALKRQLDKANAGWNQANHTVLKQELTIAELSRALEEKNALIDSLMNPPRRQVVHY